MASPAQFGLDDFAFPANSALPFQLDDFAFPLGGAGEGVPVRSADAGVIERVAVAGTAEDSG